MKLLNLLKLNTNLLLDIYCKKGVKMGEMKEITKKYFMPSIVSGEFSKDDICVYCGAPLNKGEWDKYIDKYISAIRAFLHKRRNDER